MMAHDPEGKMGPKMQLPDNVIVHEPKAGPGKLAAHEACMCLFAHDAASDDTISHVLVNQSPRKYTAL